ncbi:MAG: flagellar protein FlgN [Myxococcales bacterium]|nr:MAG: flagellar protein FlgN [Myxococcales bacterium]
MTPKATKLGLELKVVLDQEAGLLKALVEAMHEERELLVRFQPNQLVELNKRKELLVLQHSYLEQGRRELTRKLGRELGLDSDGAGLAAIAEKLDGQLGRDLQNLKSTLSALVDAVTELNSLNKQLIEFSIRSVKGSVAFLKKRFFNAGTYSAEGMINQQISTLSMIHNRA